MGMDYEQRVVDPAVALSSEEIDAIGEILNISMGSAATAISTMLDRQVIITTPHVKEQKFKEVDYKALEPALLVKIEYIEGITGSNVMMFHQGDMQIILNLLMGNEESSENFEFDELSMSAACEVMNQMMGASATALSEFLGKTINISTPTASVSDSEHALKLNIQEDEKVVSVSFNLDIKDVMNSDFISIMPIDLVKMIVSQVMGTAEEQAPVQQQETAHSSSPEQIQTSGMQQAPNMQQTPSTQQAPSTQQTPNMQQVPNMQMPPNMQQAPNMQMPPNMQQAPNMQMPPNMSPEWQQQYMMMGQQMPYPPYAYPYPPMMPVQNAAPAGQQSNVIKQTQAVHVQAAQFPNFTNQAMPGISAPINHANMGLMMNVPLSVTVEIGKTKRKIRDIMEFSQGTVIELEKQAGAPVDIVVNGQLIARGDVVVIDDNFGVRITEIVGTKELMDAIDSNA